MIALYDYSCLLKFLSCHIDSSFMIVFDNILHIANDLPKYVFPNKEQCSKEDFWQIKFSPSYRIRFYEL